MRHRLASAVLALAAAAAAQATESGTSVYPLGVGTNACGIMPPEGAHWYLNYSRYSASHSKGNDGEDNRAIAHYAIRVDVLTPRFSYVWPGVRLFGATLETRVAQPLYDMDLTLQLARPASLDRSGSARGLGDFALSPVSLGWHAPTLHQTAGLDTSLRSGRYDVDARINPGRNYAQVAPYYALTWFPAAGWDLNGRWRYAINGRNGATDYRSGNEASLEFSGGYRPSAAWAFGVNGYLYRQTSDDTQHGAAVNGNGNRGRVDALGPYLSWNPRPDWSVLLKLQVEANARNRPEGARLWLQSRMPF